MKKRVKNLLTRTKEPVFGVPLDRTKRKLPIVVSKAIEFFADKGLEDEGIFRVSAQISEVQALVERFDEGEDVNLSETDPHVVSNILKLYFRNLPDPVLTFELYDCFLAAGGLAKENLDVIKNTLSLLPAAHFRVVKATMSLLYKVSQKQEKNKMTPHNLAIVFAPTLLRPQRERRLSVIMNESEMSTKIVEALIEKFHTIFDDLSDPPEAELEEDVDSEDDNPEISLLPSTPTLLKMRHWEFTKPKAETTLSVSYMTRFFPSVALRSLINNKFVKRTKDGLLMADLDYSSSSTRWDSTKELFKLKTEATGGVVSITNDNGEYWSLRSDGVIICKDLRKEAGREELFKMVVEDNFSSNVSFQCLSGGWISVDQNRGGILASASSSKGDQTKFRVNVKVNLLSANFKGNYLSIQPNHRLESRKRSPFITETFLIQAEALGLCSISYPNFASPKLKMDFLRSNLNAVQTTSHSNSSRNSTQSSGNSTKYLTTNNNGTLFFSANTASMTELFYISRTETQGHSESHLLTFHIRTCYGTYITSTDTSAMAISDNPDPTSVFTFVSPCIDLTPFHSSDPSPLHPPSTSVSSINPSANNPTLSHHKLSDAPAPISQFHRSRSGTLTDQSSNNSQTTTNTTRTFDPANNCYTFTHTTTTVITTSPSLKPASSIATPKPKEISMKSSSISTPPTPAKPKDFPATYQKPGAIPLPSLPKTPTYGSTTGSSPKTPTGTQNRVMPVPKALPSSIPVPVPQSSSPKTIPSPFPPPRAKKTI